MIVIFYLSGRTGSELSMAFPFIKDFNPGHILAFFVLSGFYYYALLNSTKVKYLYFWTLLLSLLYALSDEYHQSFVPTRNPDTADLLRDMAGASLALLLIHLLKHYRHMTSKRQRRNDSNE